MNAKVPIPKTGVPKWLLWAGGGCGCLVLIVVSIIVATPMIIHKRLEGERAKYERIRADREIAEITQLFQLVCADPQCSERATKACERLSDAATAGRVSAKDLADLRDRIAGLAEAKYDQNPTRRAQTEEVLATAEKLANKT